MAILHAMDKLARHVPTLTTKEVSRVGLLWFGPDRHMWGVGRSAFIHVMHHRGDDDDAWRSDAVHARHTPRALRLAWLQ